MLLMSEVKLVVPGRSRASCHSTLWSTLRHSCITWSSDHDYPFRRSSGGRGCKPPGAEGVCKVLCRVQCLWSSGGRGCQIEIWWTRLRL